jgi:hypothetical protein
MSARRRDYQGFILNVSVAVAVSWMDNSTETLTLEIKAGEAKNRLNPTEEELRAFEKYVISNIPIPK